MQRVRLYDRMMWLDHWECVCASRMPTRTPSDPRIEAPRLNKPQMSHREAYRELELTEGVPHAEVKAQYRRLAKLWHPDKNRSVEATARMVRINLAYETLQEFFSSPFSGYTTHSSEPQANEARYDWWDSEAGGEHLGKRGRNITRKVKITLFEATFGCKKVIEGEVRDHCGLCGGSGVGGGRGALCEACSGRGMFFTRNANSWGGYGTEACAPCDGTGVIYKKCTGCGGSGQGSTREWGFEVTIPPGMRSGEVLRLPHKGGKSSHEALRGDVLLTIEVMAHPMFFEDEGFLVVMVPVSYLTWLLGGEVVVPLLDGSRLIQFRPQEHQIHLADQGLHHYGRGSRGPLVITLTPILDDSMTVEQRKLLEQLANELAPPEVHRWSDSMMAWTHGSTESRFGPDKPKRKPAAKKAPANKAKGESMASARKAASKTR